MLRLLSIAFLLFQFYFISVESYQCSCSCCFGTGCQANQLSSLVNATECTDTSCLAACRTQYYQCNISPPYGQAFGKCLSTTTTTASPIGGGSHTCRCDCCNSGTHYCTPNFVGYTRAYSCQASACSISCANQYPHQCLNNQYGQTQGSCVAAPTSSTAIPTGGSNRCGCVCYSSSNPRHYEALTTNGCSMCAQACHSIQQDCFAYETIYCTN